MQHYFQGVDYPADKEDLISSAKTNHAPQDVIQELEGLEEEGAEYNSYAEVLEALGYELQEEERRQG
jgi:hypothetical protein